MLKGDKEVHVVKPGDYFGEVELLEGKADAQFTVTASVSFLLVVELFCVG